MPAHCSWHKLVTLDISSAPAVSSRTSPQLGTGNTSANALSHWGDHSWGWLQHVTIIAAVTGMLIKYSIQLQQRAAPSVSVNLGFQFTGSLIVTCQISSLPAASIYQMTGSSSPVVGAIAEAGNLSTSRHTIRLLSACCLAATTLVVSHRLARARRHFAETRQRSQRYRTTYRSNSALDSQTAIGK